MTTHNRLRLLAVMTAFAPALAWVLVAAILVLSGAWLYLPPTFALLAAFAFYAGAAILLVRAILTMRWPNARAACRAVDALMEGAPASAQISKPAQNTSAALALWHEHAKRMAKQAANLKAPDFAEEWKKLDSLRLRYLLPFLTLGTLLAAGSDSASRIHAALTPDPGILFGAHRLKAQAWISPPPYTGRAPIALLDGIMTNAQQGTNAPQGSEITIRIEAPGQPHLRLGDQRQIRPVRGADGVYESKIKLDQDLNIELHYWGRRASFSLSAIKDAPPVAVLNGVADRSDDDNVELSWSGSDDYGIKSAFLITTRKDGASVETELILGQLEPEKTTETSVLDLTRHPYAGLDVTMQIRLEDAAGQAGSSNSVWFRLPEKLFLDPLASAIAEIRSEVLQTRQSYMPVQEANADEQLAPELANRIELAPDRLQRALFMLDALSYAPQGYILDQLVFLGLRHARSILSAALDLKTAHSSEDILWQTAQRVEFGNLSSAKRALDAAREALEQALRDGAPDEQVERLISALRNAIQRYLQALLARAQQTGQQAGNGGGANVQGQDFEEMLKALSELSETGARDDARRLLADMAKLLERMQNAQIRRGSGEGNMGLAGPEPEPNGKNAQDLSGLLRDQRELNDKTFAQQRRQQQDKNAEQQKLAEQQKHLSDRLEGLKDQLNEQNPDGIRELLDQALKAQKKAERSLRQGDDKTTRDAQRDAAAALREAITQMAENADGDENQQASGQRDPLDRPSGSGLNNGDGVKIPDKMERMRAREFLDELRRRSGQPQLPQPELEYLERLLRRF